MSSIKMGVTPGSEPAPEPMTEDAYKALCYERYNCIDERSGRIIESTVAGTKYDEGKLPWHLISVPAVEEMLRVLEFGAKKYTDHNWRKGFKWTRLISAAARHLFAFMRGEDRDPETGYLHTAHLMACAMFLTEHAQRKIGEDDRYVA